MSVVTDTKHRLLLVIEKSQSIEQLARNCLKSVDEGLTTTVQDVPRHQLVYQCVRLAISQAVIMGALLEVVGNQMMKIKEGKL